MKDAGLRPIVRLRSAVIDGLRLAAANTMLGVYAGADGVKTGHTNDAGWCLAASAKRGGRRIYVVGLGAADQATRDRDIARLLDWGFSQLQGVVAVRAGTVGGRLSLPYGGTVDARVAKTLRLTIRPGERVRLRYRLASAQAAARAGPGDRAGRGAGGQHRGGEDVARRSARRGGAGHRRPAVVHGRPRARPLRPLIVRYPPAW